MGCFDQNLLRLKEFLQTAQDIAEPFQYFMDNFAENSVFINSSKRSQNKELLSVIRTVAEKQFQEKLSSKRCMLMKSTEAPGFIHGICHLSEKVIAAFFFEDIGMGMLGMMNVADMPMINYCRFTTIKSANGKLTISPNSSSTIH